MPFTSKYTNLGKTERIRVPVKYVSHIESLLEEFDRICGTHNEEYVDKIVDNIIRGLNNI
jgi:hypothetical protein